VSAKPVVSREQAGRDIEDAIDHYAREAGEKVALGFIDAIETAFRAIARNPAIGSPCYAHELDLPGLRVRSPKRYPYLVFYVERDDAIDVWRVLHAHRDIAAWMGEPQGD
jgi:toxin ParE1/3/4